MILKSISGELLGHSQSQPMTKSYKERRKSKDKDCKDKEQNKRS